VGGAGGNGGAGGIGGSGGTGGTGGTGGGVTDCAEACVDIVDLAVQINCPLTVSDCNLSCDGFLTLYPLCGDEYFAALDCAVQTPAEWTCDPDGGPQFEGPSCATELGLLGACVQ
jgi:hypothetical protein